MYTYKQENGELERELHTAFEQLEKYSTSVQQALPQPRSPLLFGCPSSEKTSFSPSQQRQAVKSQMNLLAQNQLSHQPLMENLNHRF